MSQALRKNLPFLRCGLNPETQGALADRVMDARMTRAGAGSIHRF
jgi:hypothetical protein